MRTRNTLRFIRSIAALFYFGLLVACSATPDNTGIAESFRTQIFENGTKQFSFHFSRGNTTYPIKPYDQTGGFYDGHKTYTAQELRKRNRLYLHAAIDRKLEETGFCRDGYFTLEQLIDYTNGSLRGECKEGATPEDRAAFGTHWEG